MRSAIYEGLVVHRRRSPIDHRFAYRVAMPLVDLDEIDELCALHPLWSNEGRNAVCFRRGDYLGDPTLPLATAVRDVVEERLGHRPEGPVAMLAHPRTWGWAFNPITLYYCFDAGGTAVEALVGEVTNTPWHERHAYVVAGPGRHRFDKAMHVSPFLGMDMQYELAYGAPGERLSVRISTVRGGETLFDAFLRLERREASREALQRLVLSYPLMTMRVSAAIYRQAFALWRRGVPFVPHPRRRRSAVAGASAGCPLGEQLRHGRDDLAGVATGPAVGADGTGGVLVGHGRPADEHGRVERGMEGGEGLGDRRPVPAAGDGEEHAQRPVPACAPDERLGGRVGAEVDDVEARSAELVGDDRAGQLVPLAGHRSDEHRRPLASPAGELRAEPGDHATGDDGRPVLVGNAQLTSLPAVAHRLQRGRDQLEVDVRGIGPRGEGRLDDLPGTELVACHEAVEHPARGPCAARGAPVGARQPPA